MNTEAISELKKLYGEGRTVAREQQETALAKAIEGRVEAAILKHQEDAKASRRKAGPGASLRKLVR